MKACTRCHVVKPLSEYHTDKRAKDGRTPHCKGCHKIRTDAWKAANRDLVLRQEAARRERNRDADRERNRLYNIVHRDEKRASLARWRAANPEKARAQDAVKKALRSSRLVCPETCSSCGATGCRIEAHHDDYAKRLDVRWLCKPCHVLADRARKEVAA